MKIEKFIVKVLNEAVKRNLQEMPKYLEQFTLADDWETKSEEFQNLHRNNRSRGYSNLKQGLEKLQYKNFLTSQDLIDTFGYTSRQAINRAFIPDLKQAGIIIPLRGELPKSKTTTSGVEADDEWNLDIDPTSDISGELDKDLIYKNIKIEKGANRVYITRSKIWNLENNKKFIEDTTWTLTVYQFIKPYVELKYSQKINGTIDLKLDSRYYYGSTSSKTGTKNIDELFPNRKDFLEFLKIILPKVRNKTKSYYIGQDMYGNFRKSPSTAAQKPKTPADSTEITLTIGKKSYQFRQ